MYLIWSYRNRMWWKSNRAGYTPHTSQAGRYAKDDAQDICVGGSLPGANVAVDVQLLHNFDDVDVEETLDMMRRL